MKDVTGTKPEMWGTSIIGFGRFQYKYASGRELEWMMVGFSPRKNDLTLYLMTGFKPFADLMSRLGKHKTGKACIYIKRLDDVDLDVLRELVQGSVDRLTSRTLEQLR